jgi:hypothetical protein
MSHWLPPKLDAIPHLLREQDRWLLWTARGDGKKVPSAVAQPGHAIDATQPAHWSTFDRAATACVSHPRQSTGVGYALGANGGGVPVAGVDLDHCRNPHTGVVDPWALDVLRALDSYTEVSPSGTGVKVFVAGRLPEGSTQGKVYKLELYDRGRYFTVTGHHLPGTPHTVEPRDHQLQQLYRHAHSDDLRDRIKLFGLWIRERADKIDIVCPWAHEHSHADGPTDAGLLLTDGKVSGFKCFHASHANKKLPDVLRLLGIAEDQIPHLNIICAIDVPDEQREQLFGGRLVRGFFMPLVGPGEAGKGMFMADVIARLTTGRPFPGEATGREPQNVMMAVTEDSKGRVKSRLQVAEANLRNVHFVDGPMISRAGMLMPSRMMLDDDAGELLRRAKELQIRSIFLETVVEHFGDRSGKARYNTNAQVDVRRAFAPIAAVCQEGKLYGMGALHPRKSMDGGIEDSISGSAAFQHMGRGVNHVFKDPMDEDRNPCGCWPQQRSVISNSDPLRSASTSCRGTGSGTRRASAPR